jgi:hypothetical protein
MVILIYPRHGVNRKFIYFIDADDVNKWVSLGQFEVSAPVRRRKPPTRRIERRLDQQAARGGDENRRGPAPHFKEPERGIAKTRGFVPKKQKEVVSAEAVLMFTTMETVR